MTTPITADPLADLRARLQPLGGTVVVDPDGYDMEGNVFVTLGNTRLQTCLSAGWGGHVLRDGAACVMHANEHGEQYGGTVAQMLGLNTWDEDLSDWPPNRVLGELGENLRVLSKNGLPLDDFDGRNNFLEQGVTLLLDGQIVQGTLNGHLTGGCDLYQSITADGKAVLDLFVSAGDEDGPFITAVMGRELKKKEPYIPEFTEEENLPF